MTAIRSRVDNAPPAVGPGLAPEIQPQRAGAIAATLRAGPGASGVFEQSTAATVPEPARRWLNHAIEPGTPLYRRAELTMHGEIRLGRRWHPFVATEVITPDVGFVWAARAHIAGLPVVGYDAYAEGAGAMQWQLFGLCVQSDFGSCVTLSAAGRLAAEAVLLPTSLVTASWHSGHDPDTAVYGHHTSGRLAHTHVTIDVAPDGRLRSVSVGRWGNPTGHSFGRHPFAVTFDGEHRFGPLVIPDGIHASWPGSGGEFFRAAIDTAAFA